MAATESNAAIARTVYEAFNNHEFERALSYVGDEAEAEIYAQGLSFHGRDGFRDMLRYHKAPWPDGIVEVIRQLECADGVTNECVYRATHTAPLPMLDGSELPATNRKIELRFCEVWRMKDGKVVSLYNYGDNLALLHQLGVIPVPEATSTN